MNTNMLDNIAIYPVFVVIKGSPAWHVLIRAARMDSFKPGSIIQVSEKEFRSLKEDCLSISLHEDNT